MRSESRYSGASAGVRSVHVGLGLLALALCAAPAAAQTRSETEAWIIQQTQANVTGLTYAIDGEELLRRLEMRTPMTNDVVVQQAIPIRHIKRIEVLHTDRFLSYRLSCASPCVEHLTQGVAEEAGTAGKREVLLFEIYRSLDARFPPRMNKAMLKLVELHGGRATLVEQQKPKQPF